jgi:hypothetical protein
VSNRDRVREERSERDERREALDLSCLICTEKPRGKSWFTIEMVTRGEEENVRESTKSFLRPPLPNPHPANNTSTPINLDVFWRCFLLLVAELLCVVVSSKA